ncbi:MarR family winged helix-turn-helix transcriptional regulator [Streptomyces sp. NPDC058257]|uniref:MarR family winged helix-turn-helix transcriptional regulator n=1 Tax=Streptomyces sp. NPDC058257 TaxID=3346409 RepID=UPI0036E979EA
MDAHFDPSASLGFAVKRLQQAMRREMDTKLAAHGLTGPQYTALNLLAKSPGMSNAELAGRAFVTAPTMLRVIDALVRARLVHRADMTGRHRTLSLTEHGTATLAKASSEIEGIEGTLRARLDSPEQWREIHVWLTRAAEALEASPSADSGE